MEYIEQFFCRAFRIIDISHNRIHDLPQIVGRNAGTHSYRNSLRAVDQQVGHADRKNLRLLLRLIIIRDKRYGLVQIL